MRCLLPSQPPASSQVVDTLSTAKVLLYSTLLQVQHVGVLMEDTLYNIDAPSTAQETTLLRIRGTGALGALFWGTWGTRLGHLGHSFGELGAPGALVWGT